MAFGGRSTSLFAEEWGLSYIPHGGDAPQTSRYLRRLRRAPQRLGTPSVEDLAAQRGGCLGRVACGEGPLSVARLRRWQGGG